MPFIQFQGSIWELLVVGVIILALLYIPCFRPDIIDKMIEGDE